jgi:CDP-diglyceride synthetase
MNIHIGFILSLIIVAIFSLNAAFKTGRRAALIELFSDKHTFYNLIIMLGFIGYMVYLSHTKPEDEETRKIVDALKKAIVAFTIALFSKIDLIFAPFWFVWILAYYLDNWV